MKPFAFLALFLSATAMADDAYLDYLCTITSTAASSLSMQETSASGTTPACPSVKGQNANKKHLAVQCDVAAYVAVGSGSPLNADADYDGDSDIVGVLVQANAIVPIDLSSGEDNLATISVAGTSNCKVFSVNEVKPQ